MSSIPAVIGYWVKFKIIPTDGPAEEIDFGGLGPGSMTYMHAPAAVDIDAGVEIERRITVNRKLRPRYVECRPSFTMTVNIGGDATDIDNDHRMVTRLINAYVRDRSVVHLSLDNGQTWRQVALTKYAGPKKQGEKYRVGVSYVMAFETADPETSVRALTDSSTDGVPSGF